MSDIFSLSGNSGRSGVTLNLFRGCLVATLPVDLSGDTLALFRRELLDQLAKARAKHVVFDCAGLELLDPEEFQALGKLAAMAGLLGASVILAGLRPAIVTSLITMGEDCGKFRGALNLDDALQMLEDGTASPPLDDPTTPDTGSELKQNDPQKTGGDHVG